MKLKRLLAVLLVTATLASTLPAASAASLSSFRDITDPAVAEQAEFLRLLGVVNGKPGGGYDPGGTFTRAEFVKMAICALDRADEEPAQRNRTIYLDVGPTFWARGYINLASVIKLGTGDGATSLVMGAGDGNFYPWNAITYGEAVTILCRMLGYGAADVSTGGAWYEGYLAVGKAAGLTDGVTAGGADVITRAQAATLFYNLYFSNPKGSDKTYLTTLGGNEVDYAVVLDTDATADDGTIGCFRTTRDTYKTDRAFDASLEGQEGKAVLDADGRLLAFRPKEGTSDRLVTITSAKSAQLVTSAGEKLTMEDDTAVYREGKTTTWSAVYSKVNDSAPAPVTLHYGANGKLAYLFFPGGTDEKATVMVARSAPRNGSNPFTSLADGGSYIMYKNGLTATGADIRQYDVATWDPAARVIRVSDVKLTGVYEDASPSPSDPATARVMGHTFTVLPAARSDLAAFQIGDRVTLLLTADSKVAGVVSEDVVKGSPVGLASVSGTTATVTLLESGLEVSGETYSGAADRYNNQLVTVTSTAAGRLSLSAVSGSTGKGALDVSAGTLGDKELAGNVKVYDRVKNGALVEVDYNQLPAAIAQSKIGFALYDYAGRVKCLVLDDATGDAYEYGYFVYKRGAEGEDFKEPDTLCVRQGGEGGADAYSKEGNFVGSVRNGAAGGVAYAPNGKVAATVTLQSLTGVGRSAFDVDEMTVTVAGVSYPVSAKVQVYNRTTKRWLATGQEGLEAARAYSDELTLWYDRAPADGGKIRMIVIP